MFLTFRKRSVYSFRPRYKELSFSDCDNIIDFAKKLRKAKNKLLELDASCRIGKLHFIHKFLSSLGLSFDSQTHSLLPIKASDDIVSTAMVAFNSYGRRKSRATAQVTRTRSDQTYHFQFIPLTIQESNHNDSAILHSLLKELPFCERLLVTKSGLEKSQQ